MSGFTAGRVRARSAAAHRRRRCPRRKASGSDAAEHDGGTPSDASTRAKADVWNTPGAQRWQRTFRRRQLIVARVAGTAGGPGTPPDWPEMGKAAYHGLVGDVVATLLPQTEADPVALLMQYLVYFGNAVGRGPYYLVESSKHFANLFVLLAGATAKARKGLSADRVRSIFRDGRSRLGSAAASGAASPREKASSTPSATRSMP